MVQPLSLPRIPRCCGRLVAPGRKEVSYLFALHAAQAWHGRGASSAQVVLFPGPVLLLCLVAGPTAMMLSL